MAFMWVCAEVARRESSLPIPLTSGLDSVNTARLENSSQTCGCVQNWPEDEENGVEFRYLCGNVDHSGALEEAGVCEADAIIIGPAEDLPDNEVCAQGGFHQPEQPYKDAVCKHYIAMFTSKKYRFRK